MMKSVFSIEIRQTPAPGVRAVRRNGSLRVFGVIMLALAGFLAWATHGFHAEKHLSAYPEIQLTYTTCNYEKITHYRSTTKQIVFATANGGYVMEDGVWKRHFDGPTLADALSRGGTVRAWVHPRYSHALRGILGGTVDIPPEWGLECDQGNMKAGIWMESFLVLAGTLLCFWRR
jgi:hypothetical protein